MLVYTIAIGSPEAVHLGVLRNSWRGCGFEPMRQGIAKQRREIDGIVDWSPAGRGRIFAQLQKLTIPAGPEVKPGAPREKLNETEESRESATATAERAYP